MSFKINTLQNIDFVTLKISKKSSELFGIKNTLNQS